MTNEELILEKLDSLQTQIQPLIRTSQRFAELKEDLIPISNHATALLIKELTEIEAGFQLEDMTTLIKEAARNTRNFIFALKQMASMIEFIKDLEPLLKSAVPQLINYLDDLEQKGVFRIINATVQLRSKVAAAYTAEDIEKMGDGFVGLLGLAKGLSDPKAMEFLKKFSSIPAKVDLSQTRKVGLLGLASDMFKGEVTQGLGVMLELTKAVGKINQNTQDS